MWPDVMDGYVPLGDKTTNSPVEDLALCGSAYTLIIVRQAISGAEKWEGGRGQELLIPPYDASNDGDATLSTLLLAAHKNGPRSGH